MGSGGKRETLSLIVGTHMEQPPVGMCVCSPSMPVRKREPERSSWARLDYTVKQKRKRDPASKASWKGRSGAHPSNPVGRP